MLKKFSKAIRYIASSINFKRPAFLLLALCFLLAGCKKEVEVAVFEESNGQADVNELPIPESNAPAEQRTLSIITTPNPASLHPLAVLDENTANLLSLIFEPAIRISADGKFLPSVIESWEQSDDALSYTFHIRKNVSFHGNYGTVTADDLIFALDKIKNADPNACEYAKYREIAASYEKVDDLTLRVTVSKKSSDIFYLMSFPVMPRDYYGSLELNTTKTPIGTGPYYVASYSKEEGFTLEQNVVWWKTPPVFTRIIAKPVVDSELQIGSEQLDSFGVISTSLMTAGSYAASGKTNVNQVVTPTYDCLVPNYNNSLLSNKEVREAISIAINRSELISMGLLGQGQAAEMPVNPNFWAYEGLESSAGVYNVSEANAILERAGYPMDQATGYRYRDVEGSRQNLKFKLLYTESANYAYRKAVCEKIAEQLKRVGIEVELVEADSATYKEHLKNNNFQLALCSFYTSANDDNAFLYSDANFGKAPTSALREKLDAYRAAVTSEEIKIAFADYVKEYLAEIPTIGLYYRTHAMIVNASIEIPSRCGYKSVYADIGQWK